jgi:hypothetical protein
LTESVGRGGAGALGGAPTIVEADVFGLREDPRGASEGPAGLADLDSVAAEFSAGGPPACGDRPPTPPSRAMLTPATTTTTSAAAVTINRTPWRKRISSRRAWRAAVRADGRP